MERAVRFFCILFTTCFYACFGQTDIREGYFYTNKDTLVVETAQASKEIYYVKDNGNKYNSNLTYSIDTILLAEYSYETNLNIGDIVVSALKETEIKKLALNEEHLYAGVILNADGEILQVNFMIDKNTVLSIEALSTIKNKIRAQYSAKVKGNEMAFTVFNYFIDSQTVVFSQDHENGYIIPK